MLKKIFFKILWKSRKDYFLIVLSGIFIISFVFFSTAVGSCLNFVSSGEVSEMTALIGDVEKAYFLPYLLLLFLMFLILISYIRKRSADYALLTILGLKKKHRYAFIGAEYISIIILSVGGGILLGLAESEIMRRILEHVFSDITDHILLGWSPFKLTAIISLLLFGFGFILCDHMIACLGIDAIASMGKKSGKAIRKFPLLIILGIVFIVLSFVTVVTYWGQIGSSVPQAFAAAGLILLMLFGGGSYLFSLREKKKKYYKKLLCLDNWYHQFYYHMNMTYITAAFLFIILFSFLISFLDNIPFTQPENYPHDLVWMANSGDEEFLESLKENYGVQIETRQSLRVATADYGEHSGISASEYEAWTGKSLDLDDKEIYVVYQRDREELGTIGIDFGSKKPRMYIGNSADDLWIFMGRRIQPSNHLVRDYTIKGTENRILTGNFKTRSVKMPCDVFEDIIVFSDEEFERIRPHARGANLMVVMDIPTHYDEVLEEVSAYAKEHSQVNYYDWRGGNLIYDGRRLGIECRQQKTYGATSMLINIITLFSCIIFVLLEKSESDYEDMAWKYQFYYRAGMTKKKRKKNIYSEVFLSAKVAVGCSSILAMALLAEKIWNKHLPGEWILKYLAEIGVFLPTVIIIIYIIMRIVSRNIFSRIEKGNKDGRKGL